MGRKNTTQSLEFQENKHLRLNTKNRRKQTIIEKCHELSVITGCSVFLKIVDSECNKSYVYSTDDLYMTYTVTGLKPSVMEIRTAGQDVPMSGFDIMKPVPPSPLKVRKENNAELNCILPGGLKKLPLFVPTDQSELLEETITTSQISAQKTTNETCSDTSLKETPPLTPTPNTEALHTISTDETPPITTSTHVQMPSLTVTPSTSTDTPSLTPIISTETTSPIPEVTTTGTTDSSTAESIGCGTGTVAVQQPIDSAVDETVVTHLLDILDEHPSILAETTLDLMDDISEANTQCINLLDKTLTVKHNICRFCGVSFEDDLAKGRRKKWVACDGKCKEWLHTACLPKKFPRPSKTIRHWRCPQCIP